MTATFVPGNLQWVGVAKETTYGTAIATPTLYVPVDSPTYKAVITALKDQNLRGLMSNTFQQIQGLRHDEISFKTSAYLDSAYFLLRSVLGIPDAISGSAAPYTHTTSVRNSTNAGQPEGTTVFWADGNGAAWQMPGAQISTLKITAKSEALYEIDVTYVGLPATQITAPTNSPTTALPFPAWNSTLTLGGTAFTTYSEVDLEFKRATEAIATLNGTQAPYAIYAGGLDVTGSFTAVYAGAADTQWADYLANTQSAFTLKAAPVGDSVNSLKIQLSKVAYDSATVSGTNKWMELKAKVTALANATDALDGTLSPAKAVLLSSASTVI